MLLSVILKEHFSGGVSKPNKYEYKIYIDFKGTQVKIKHKMMYNFIRGFKKQISSALRIHVSLTKLEQSQSLKTFC